MALPSGGPALTNQEGTDVLHKVGLRLANRLRPEPNAVVGRFDRVAGHPILPVLGLERLDERLVLGTIQRLEIVADQVVVDHVLDGKLSELVFRDGKRDDQGS